MRHASPYRRPRGGGAWAPPRAAVTLGSIHDRHGRLRADAGGWLTEAELSAVRTRLPILYVDAVPVRVDESGDVIAVGLLLRVNGVGEMTRALVSGRVMYHERVRDALLRHLEKDLGPVALPQIPAAPQPFTVAEYLPTPGITPYHDPRQHAVLSPTSCPSPGTASPSRTPWSSPGSPRRRRAPSMSSGR